MRWRLAFYNERRGLMASYAIEAPTPTAAVVLGRNALFVEHRPKPARRSVSGFEQAQRVGGLDPSGWILYRIVKDV